MPPSRQARRQRSTDRPLTHPQIPGDQGRTGPDGADALFELLADRSPDTYIRFAEDYYETSLDPAAVTALLSHQPLTATTGTVLAAAAWQEPSER